MSSVSVIAIVVAAVVVLLAAGWAYQTANRLDRLNVRVDLARQALESSLERRTVVVRAIAAWMDADRDPAQQDSSPGQTGSGGAAGTPVTGRDLVRAADAAEHAPAELREDAENAVSAVLARTERQSRPPALAIELADAETRVMMARRFYNDAVRDTRSLADSLLVRGLRLGGRAAPPQYFEIVERISPSSHL